MYRVLIGEDLNFDPTGSLWVDMPDDEARIVCEALSSYGVAVALQKIEEGSEKAE